MTTRTRKLVANPIKRLQSQVLKRADFFDNGDATGRIDLSKQLPAGAIVLGWSVNVKTGFIGDALALMQVGKSGSIGAYSSGSADIFSAPAKKAVASADATSNVDSDTTPRVTVTGAADFTAITAGEMTVTIYYLDTLAKPI